MQLSSSISKWGSQDSAYDNPKYLTDYYGTINRDTLVLPDPVNGTYKLYIHFYSDTVLGDEYSDLPTYVLDFADTSFLLSPPDSLKTNQMWYVGNIIVPQMSLERKDSIWTVYYP